MSTEQYQPDQEQIDHWIKVSQTQIDGDWERFKDGYYERKAIPIQSIYTGFGMLYASLGRARFLNDDSYSALRSLGDESGLATMQHIATQQILQMRQMDLLLETQNQQLQHYEPLSVIRANTEARAIDREIERLRRVQGRTNAASGTSNYADLGL